MNKYAGFYELKSINLPTVPWKLFTEDTVLDGKLLWTVRVAVETSNDLNLPRAVGLRAEAAEQKGKEFLRELEGKGIVIYYPYFIAEKSGVLDINSHRTVIEAVDRDLWNLVTHGRKNVTAVFPTDSFSRPERFNVQYHGDETFLGSEETDELLKFGTIIKGKFRDKLSEGRSVLAEWSYAFNTDVNHMPIGDRYLVFYELRCL